MNKWILRGLAAAVFTIWPLLAVSPNAFAENILRTPDDPVRKALNSVPGYGVFDFLSYQPSADGKVILLGQVTSPELSRKAADAVRAVPGIGAVENHIEVLPKSAADDEVRKAVYDAVYKGPAPSIYEPEHTIHIVVKNQDVTLEGTVRSEIDHTLLAATAAGAGNVKTLTDHLVATAADVPDAQWRRNMEAIAGK